MSFTKNQKALSLLVSVCMVFCVVSAPALVVQSDAAVGAVPVIAVASAVVVASVLIGAGIIMTDKNAFSNLCNDIVNTLELGMTLPLRVLATGTYLAKETVLQIIAAANAKKAFTAPSRLLNMGVLGNLPIYTTTNGLKIENYPYSRVKNSSLSSWNGFPVMANRCDLFKLSADGWLARDAYTPVLPVGSQISINLPGNNNPYYISNSFVGVVEQYNSITGGVMYSPFFLSKHDYMPDFSMPQYCYGLNTGHEVYFYKADADVIDGWKVGSKTPSISADGTVSDLPLDWAGDSGIPIEGAPSLPLTIPNDRTVPGAGAMTQIDAQSGTAPKEGEKTDVDTPIKQEDIDKIKLPQLFAQKFPFCIPFDIYNGVALLMAPAVEPVFTLPFKFDFAGMHFSENIELNFKQFEEPIKILRWGELLIFIIGLAAVTKKIVWG